MMSIFKKKHTQSYDKMNKKPVLKTSICTGEQVAGFQDIHTGKIEEIMLIKQTGDIDTFKKATKEQTEAITQTEGNIRVASVPGSGKTFVLTYRIAYLITELFVEPSSIVALTFTNKAASQMKHRLWKIKNIHWVGLHLIRSRNMSGQKLNCRLFLRLNKNMILIIQRMPKMFWMP